MATVEKELFTFPAPHQPDQVEWPGTPIGSPRSIVHATWLLAVSITEIVSL